MTNRFLFVTTADYDRGTGQITTHGFLQAREIAAYIRNQKCPFDCFIDNSNDATRTVSNGFGEKVPVLSFSNIDEMRRYPVNTAKLRVVYCTTEFLRTALRELCAIENCAIHEATLTLVEYDPKTAVGTLHQFGQLLHCTLTNPQFFMDKAISKK